MEKRIFVLDSYNFNGIIKLSKNIEKTAEGYLKLKNVVVGHVGDLVYRPKELGIQSNFPTIIVHRTEEELFNPDSLETLEGKSLTIEHPRVNVDPNNVNDLEKGVVLNVRANPENSEELIADILVKNKIAIELIEKKKMRGVSLGYSAKLIPDEIIGNKFYYKEVVYNHLALCKQGRAKKAVIRDSSNLKGEIKLKDFIARFKINDEEISITKKATSVEDIKSFITDSFEELKEEDILSINIIDNELPEENVKDEDKKNSKEKEKEKEGEDEDDNEENDKKENVKDNKEKPKEVKDSLYIVKRYNELNSLPNGEFKREQLTILDNECKEITGKSLFAKDSAEYKSIFDSIEPKNILEQKRNVKDNEKEKPNNAISSMDYYNYRNKF